jgi:hypothetical protein
MISEVLEAINTRLRQAGIATDVLAAPEGTPYTFTGVKFFLPGNTSKPHQPPRLVWILLGDEHLKGRSARPPRQVPGHAAPLAGRQLLVTKHNAMAHLWADGKPSGVTHEQALYVLKAQLVEHCLDLCGRGEGGVRFGEGDYVDKEGATLDRGEAYLLKVEFFTPVLAARGNTVKARPEAFSQETGMYFPSSGNDIVGSPAP